MLMVGAVVMMMGKVTGRGAGAQHVPHKVDQHDMLFIRASQNRLDRGASPLQSGGSQPRVLNTGIREQRSAVDAQDA